MSTYANKNMHIISEAYKLYLITKGVYKVLFLGKNKDI